MLICMGKTKLRYMIYDLEKGLDHEAIPVGAEIVGFRFDSEGRVNTIKYGLKGGDNPFINKGSLFLRSMTIIERNDRKYTPEEKEEIFKYIKSRAVKK